MEIQFKKIDSSRTFRSMEQLVNRRVQKTGETSFIIEYIHKEDNIYILGSLDEKFLWENYEIIFDASFNMKIEDKTVCYSSPYDIHEFYKPINLDCIFARCLTGVEHKGEYSDKIFPIEQEFSKRYFNHQVFNEDGSDLSHNLKNISVESIKIEDYPMSYREYYLHAYVTGISINIINGKVVDISKGEYEVDNCSFNIDGWGHMRITHRLRDLMCKDSIFYIVEYKKEDKTKVKNIVLEVKKEESLPAHQIECKNYEIKDGFLVMYMEDGGILYENTNRILWFDANIKGGK
ncbi:MAG: hypothetical protein U9N59_08580 [Campylobacterota bacterium]|nr:hypothetical protein [Campylobacterota bacterium]